MKRGITLVEALVGLVVALVVVSGVLTLVRSVRRMADSGELAGALTDAALAMAAIEQDLTQAVRKPDPGKGETVRVRRGAIQFVRGELKANGDVLGRAVVYEKLPAPGGFFRLRRTFDGAARNLPGLFRSIEFQELRGSGGPFVRVTLIVSTHGRADARGSENAVLSSLVRVMAPELSGSSAFSWDFLKLKGK